MSIEVRRTTARDPAFTSLVRELDAEMWQRYGALQAAFAVHNEAAADAVVVAYDGAEPIGCGGLRRLEPSTIELKRMFVAVARRGAGVGRAIVRELEVWARELGYAAIVLETGNLQPDAVALYAACGFGPIAAYGPYAAIASSICMRKLL